MRPSIFLVGPMGAGKSTVGKALAKLEGMTFIDVDAELEQRCGVDIPYIFEREGEDGFREREQALIDELTLRRDVVLATGGGVVKRHVNRDHLSARGVVVYLYASVDQQFARTQRNNRRPLLQVPDPRSVLQTLMEERDPLYREIADLVIVSSGRAPRHVAERIHRELHRGPT